MVIGDRGLADGKVEYKGRADEDSQDMAAADISAYLTDFFAD